MYVEYGWLKKGFNFQLPKKYRYTEENPYIGRGLSREVKTGKAYTGFEADVAEFNDIFMGTEYFSESKSLKMGLGIDELLPASCNLSRKNYMDYFPEKPYPQDVKFVGNTIKSKKMPAYIEKFIDKACRDLLQKKGQEFIESYYDYIDKIYNYRIPMKDIASKGKVKKTLDDYIIDCNTITKAGRPKSRQAWMELALRNNLNVNMGETIYYINTGKSKSQADVKKVTHYYITDGMFNEKRDVRVMLEKEWKSNSVDGKGADKKNALSLTEWVKRHHSEVTVEDEVILNCRLVSREVIESEGDIYCEEGQEYNVPKYIEQFNKRIKPLLVCFHPNIRQNILITNPDERQYFTAEECELCSGYPNKEGDQDTYEQLMTMEDKEIRFWMKHPEWKIPFLTECGMNWDDIRSDYEERMRKEKEMGIDLIRNEYEELLKKMDSEDFDKFEDGELPSEFNKIIDIDPKTGNFVSKQYPDVVIGTIYDIFDAKQFKANLAEWSDESLEEASEDA